MKEGSLERGLHSAWEQLGPLSVGAVISSVVVVGASALLRRALGSKRHLLGWAGAAALLPIGLWLLSAGGEGGDAEHASDEASAPTAEA
jgi:threonine/homoserine/homoserine lactone efflux protein